MCCLCVCLISQSFYSLSSGCLRRREKRGGGGCHFLGGQICKVIYSNAILYLALALMQTFLVMVAILLSFWNGSSTFENLCPLSAIESSFWVTTLSVWIPWNPVYLFFMVDENNYGRLQCLALMLIVCILTSYNFIYSGSSNVWELYHCLQVCSRPPLFCYWGWRWKWAHPSHCSSGIFWCSWSSS